jgi:succinate-semialdehyde dehydrogenase/glutarate-semialdehyde dehydrogenase
VAPAQVQAIVDDVARVQPAWAQLSLADRASYMRRAAQVLVNHADEIAGLLTSEQGKPLLESHTMEIVPTIDLLNWCADNGPRILADEPIKTPQLMLKQKRNTFVYEPIGVVGVIAPWNYPWSIPFGEVAIALMAGNGVVLKPASLTPLIGEKIREVFERAGLPEGIVRAVHGGGAVGQALVESSAGKIFFTGSVEVGRRVGEECARRMKGSVLELGGKDPQIVCADANLPNAISGAVWGGFANAGQTCSGIERSYVVEQVAERFVEGVGVEASESLIEEERLQAAAATRCQLDQAEGEREAGEERLTSGQGFRVAGLSGDAVDDPEVFGEAVAGPRHRAEDLGGEAEQRPLSSRDDVSDEAAVGEEAGEGLEHFDTVAQRHDPSI